MTEFRNLLWLHEPGVFQFAHAMQKEFPEIKLKKLYCPVKNEILRTVSTADDSTVASSTVLQTVMLIGIPSSTRQGTQGLGGE